MADLSLFSKIAIHTLDGIERILGTCLLVYDEENFTDEALSNDLREELENDPTLSRIYVVAPRVTATDVIDQIRNGSSQLRPSQHENDQESLLRIVLLKPTETDSSFGLVEAFFLRKRSESDTGLQYEENVLDPNLIQGWLFNLFLQREAMVLAPSGVHFGKTSGKHSDRFLRTANVLTS